MSHVDPDYDPWHMAMGAVVGIASALYVASIVRRWIGPIIGNPTARLGGVASGTDPFPSPSPSASRPAVDRLDLATGFRAARAG